MKVIGITGGIGAGKSAVVDLCLERPLVRAAKADEIGHRAMEPGEEPCLQIALLFGEEALREDGSVDRERLSKIVFSDPAKLEALNGIIHPYVREKAEEAIRDARAAGCRYFLLESAILLESGFRDLCDEVWAVTAPEGLRRERLRRTRGYDDEKITSILREQMGEEEMLRCCDERIENDGDWEKVRRKLNLLLV